MHQRPGRILVLEDLAEVRDWLASLAGELFPDAALKTAANKQQALELIHGWQPDLALIDLGLPDGSGNDVIVWLKASDFDCYCIVTTIFDDSAHLFGALKAGADGYLLKDEPAEHLADAISGILQGRPPLSPSIARRMLQFFQPSPREDTQLTNREEEVLCLVARGYSVRSSAEMLQLSHHTVAGYMKTIYQKLQVNSRAEATMKAIDMGLINPAAD
jgi:DNA-binding NarL/FixJ family response regulator